MNPSDTERNPIPFRGAAWAVVAIALAVRLLHVYFTQRFNPLASDLQLDAATYDRWARALAFGDDPGPTVLMQSPVYPWFLALVYRAFGPSLAAARIAQAALGAASCGLVMLATRRLFASAAAALVAGVVMTLYAPLIFYEGVLVPATLVVFLSALFVAVLSAARRPSGPRLVASGAVLGALSAASPSSILIFPFALLHVRFAGAAPGAPFAGRAGAARAPRRFLTGALLFTVGLVAALSPLTVRNALLTGEFIPLTTGAGINFYHGNNPGANGFYQVPVYRGISLGGTPEEQAINMVNVASKQSGRALSRTEVSNFWLRAGLDFIRTHPRAWLSLLGRKFRFFWNDYERANVENFAFHRRFGGILSLPLFTFGLIAPLGILGALLTGAAWKRLWLLYGGVLASLVTALAFYVLARYRLSVVVFLIPFAGAACARLFSFAFGRRIKALALSLAALAILAVFSNAPAARDTRSGIAGYYVRAGSAYLARGDSTRAGEEYRAALELDRGNEAARRGLERITRRPSESLPPDQELR